MRELYLSKSKLPLAAQAEQAQLNLGFTRIVSPIDGIASIAPSVFLVFHEIFTSEFTRTAGGSAIIEQ